MTTVTVFQLPDGTLSGFDCRGHADFADAGEDIVCAAVSALTQGTLNGLLNVLNEKDGVLTASLGDVPENKRAGAQLLLKTLVSALQMIEADYARHIRVIFKERR